MYCTGTSYEYLVWSIFIATVLYIRIIAAEIVHQLEQQKNQEKERLILEEHAIYSATTQIPNSATSPQASTATLASLSSATAVLLSELDEVRAELIGESQSLQKRMKRFLERIDEKRQALELSMNFFLHIKELGEWFREILAFLALHLGVPAPDSSTSASKSNSNSNSNAGSFCLLPSHTIATLEYDVDTLEKQRDVTSDAVTCTMQEGEKLLKILKSVSRAREISSLI